MEVAAAVRLPDWPERLQSLIDRRLRAPFVFGAHDCCMFVVAVIEAVTGRHVPVSPYSSERGAARVLRSMGGFDGAMGIAGGEPVPIPMAQRGDVVLVEQPGVFGRALAVCVGSVAMAAGGDGLVRVPRDRWIKAWRL